MRETIVGAIHITHNRKINLEWRIPYSDVKACNPGDFLRSPDFDFMNVSCNIAILRHNSEFYPRYQFCLSLRDETVRKNLDLTLGFTDNGRLLISFGMKDTVVTSPYMLIFSPMTEILTYKRLLGTEEIVTIYCKLRLLPDTDVGTQTTIDRTPQLCSDLGDLLENPKDSDMTIQVKDRSFAVHKLILRQRLDVFDAMFNHDTVEKNDSLVTITDCDPDVFHEFLRYVYTGKPKNISRVNIVALYIIADKYCVDHLKDYCVEVMMDNICLDTAYDILILADRHNHAQLKMRAKKLIVDNWKELIETKEWESIIAYNYSLALEIIQKAALKSA